MKKSQYISKIINEVIGKEYLRVDTKRSGYINFLKAHTDGLSPEDASIYEKWFQDKMQFISDFHYCFLAIYIDYYRGKVIFPVEEVARDIIWELLKSHYPPHRMSDLHDMVYRDNGFINGYVDEFKGILKRAQRYFFVWQGYTRIQIFASVNAHQLVNIISPEDMVKTNEFVPLRLHKNRGSGEDLENHERAIGEDLENNNVRDDEEEDIPDYLVDLHNATLNRKNNIKTKWKWFIAILIVIFLVTYLTTASLNPLAVLNANNMLAKNFVYVLAYLLAILLLQILISPLLNKYQDYKMRQSVEIGTGRPADSAICPSCGVSVFENNDMFGLPIVCHTCHVAWHDGPKCYRKGMPPSNDLLPSYPCYSCRSSNNLMIDES